VADHLAAHVAEFPPVEIEMIDETSGVPVTRTVPLMFTTTHGTRSPIGSGRGSG
jgi:hypothetical protein